MKKEVKIAIIAIVILVIIALGVFVATKLTSAEEVGNNPYQMDEIVSEGENNLKNIKIFSSSNERPIAFMIDNNVNAQPQSSINKAFAVYEVIVEGNETRLMALFKGVDVDEVGPMRSSRHYFLDYAMEYDAIYAHLGLSPQADADMNLYRTNNINGQIYDTGKARTNTAKYWRDKSRKAPHNAYTNTSKILEICKEKNYKTTTTKGTPFNYVEHEVELKDSYITANDIKIPYAEKHLVEYKYDEETKRYTRYSKGKKQTDKTDGQDITTKNIIITFAKNHDLPDKEDKGRQQVVTWGTLDGYYITNGKAIKIKCQKNVREEQTKYMDLEGNEIEINDGNTFINICPIDAKVTIE
ncbi:MAG: DUF3048 domain-containing protein [Clostridia bacterium]|nr:DUF3048 domain-containing protein [Clostridia bacterium]